MKDVRKQARHLGNMAFQQALGSPGAHRSAAAMQRTFPKFHGLLAEMLHMIRF
jgi:hypothetical protein